RWDEGVGEVTGGLLLRRERLARHAELALEVIAELLHVGPYLGDRHRLRDDVGDERHGAATGEGLRGVRQGMEEERTGRLTVHGERQDGEALAGQRARGRGLEAAVRQAAEEAGRARLHQARERQPARLALLGARPAQALRLRREADEREVAARSLAERDGAGLDRERLHQRLRDPLRAVARAL